MSYHGRIARPDRQQRQRMLAQVRRGRNQPRRRMSQIEGSPIEIDPAREKRALFGLVLALPLSALMWGGILAFAHVLF